MGCGCNKNKFQRNVTGGVYGPRSGLKNAQRELPTPILRQMALRKQINDQTKQQRAKQLKTVRQRIIKDKITQLRENKKRK